MFSVFSIGCCVMVNCVFSRNVVMLVVVNIVKVYIGMNGLIVGYCRFVCGVVMVSVNRISSVIVLVVIVCWCVVC